MKNPGFWYLFGAQSMSTFGDYFGLMAIEWLFYDMTGSLVAMGLLGAAFGVSQFVVQFLGAPIIDRVNRLKLMAILDIIRFAAIMILFILGMMGLLETYYVYGIAIIIGSCDAIFNPASMTVLPKMMNEHNLVRGLSLMDGSHTVASLIGPIFASSAIAFFGPLVGICIDAVTFLISGTLLYLLSKRYQDSKLISNPPTSSLKSYIGEIFDGFKFYRHAKALLLIQCFVSIKNMCSVGVWTMIIPYGRAYLHVGAIGIGLLSTSSSIGLLIGIIAIGAIGDIKHRRIPMLGSMLIYGFLLILLGLSHSLWMSIFVIALMGVCGPFFGTLSSALYARMVPDQIRGKVMSTRLLVGGSLQPVGSYAVGGVSQLFGIAPTFIAAGAIPLILSIIGFFIPTLKQIDGDIEEIKALGRVETPKYTKGIGKGND